MDTNTISATINHTGQVLTKTPIPALSDVFDCAGTVGKSKNWGGNLSILLNSNEKSTDCSNIGYCSLHKKYVLLLYQLTSYLTPGESCTLNIYIIQTIHKI